MKKIALYIESLRRGGAERVMSVLANYLSEKKYEIVLITDVFDGPEISQYEVNANIKRYYLNEMCDGKANLLKRNFQKVFNLRKICKKEFPDIVLSFLGNCNIRLLLSTIGLKCKTVVSVRNDPAREYRGKEKLSKFLFRMADGCVFQTFDAMAWFGKYVQRKGDVIFNPVDSRFYSKKWEANNGAIVTFGRLVEQKNHELLLKAFHIVHAKKPNLSLSIYGDDFAANGKSRKESINKLICELGLEGKVHLKGNVEQVPDILVDSRMFVLSSDYEGMPNALMEAMTVGTPAVSTDCPCGGPALLTEKGKYGLLVPCGNADALAKAMLSILMDEKYAEELSNSERKRAMEFSTEKVLKKWEEYLLTVYSRG